jgi:hypothetical protein
MRVSPSDWAGDVAKRQPAATAFTPNRLIATPRAFPSRRPTEGKPLM